MRNSDQIREPFLNEKEVAQDRQLGGLPVLARFAHCGKNPFVGLFNRRMGRFDSLTVTAHGIVDVQFLGKGTFGATSIPFGMVEGLEADLNGRTIHIHLYGRGSIARDLGAHATEFLSQVGKAHADLAQASE
jgi:hypothetical protein